MTKWTISGGDDLYLDGKRVAGLHTIGGNAHIIVWGDDAVDTISFRDPSKWRSEVDDNGTHLDVLNTRLNPPPEPKPSDGNPKRTLTDEELIEYSDPAFKAEPGRLYVEQERCKDCPLDNRECADMHEVICLGIGLTCLIPVDIYNRKQD